MESLSLVAKNIEDRDFFCIITHNYPDGDAVGSAFGVCRLLQKIGKHAKVNFGCEIPEKFRFLSEYIIQEEFEPKNYIAVDLADTQLLHESLKNLSDRVDICIDHHKSNKNYAKINYVDGGAAANCEVLFELAKEFGIEMDKELAECLYVGISTDTGAFMYTNTTARTHRIAAELLTYDINANEINEKLFIMETKKHFELKKIIYNNLKFCFDNTVAISYVTLEEMQKAGISDNELDGIASIPIKIEGVELGITVREKADGYCKVSVRTRNKIDADKFCANFGGGGHERAGGFNIEGKALEAVAKIKSFVESLQGESR